MTRDTSRRVFLRGAGLAAVGVGFHPSSLLVRTAEAAGAGPRSLVHVFIRGGLDGLSVAVNVGTKPLIVCLTGFEAPTPVERLLEVYPGARFRRL